MEKTTEEKIDYIYNHIKTERKFIYWRRFFKFLMYLFFIAYLYYFYMYGFEKLKDSIMQSVKPNINSESIVEWLKDNSWDIIENIKKSDLIKKFVNENKDKINLDNY